jgi:hypothetical protein
MGVETESLASPPVLSVHVRVIVPLPQSHVDQKAVRRDRVRMGAPSVVTTRAVKANLNPAKLFSKAGRLNLFPSHAVLRALPNKSNPQRRRMVFLNLPDWFWKSPLAISLSSLASRVQLFSVARPMALSGSASGRL